MKPLITLQQIAAICKVAANTRPEDYNPVILDAQQFDIVSVFPINMLQAIEANLISNIKQWNRTTVYVEGDKIFYNDGSGVKYWICATGNTDSAPVINYNNDGVVTSGNANWTVFELMNFYTDYLVPYLSYAFYYRFVAEHGISVAQHGLVNMADATFNPISDGQRGAYLGLQRSKVTAWSLKTSAAINAVNYTFDGVKYDSGECCNKSSIKVSPKIFGVGGRHKKSSKRWGFQE